MTFSLPPRPRGAAGFWVENVVIQYPVEEITIAGNLRGNIRTESLLIEEMMIAGE